MIDLVIIIVFLFFSALFSGIEIAFTSFNRIVFYANIREKKTISNILRYLLKHSDSFLISVLIGNNIAMIVSTMSFSNLLLSYNVPLKYITLYTTLYFTPILLLCGEIVPKAIFRQFSDILIYKFAYLFLFIYILFYPLQLFFTTFINLIKKIFHISNVSFYNNVTSKEFVHLLDIAQQNKELTENEKYFIINILNLHKMKVQNIMQPLKKVPQMYTDITRTECLEYMKKYHIYELPLFSKEKNTWVGYVLKKDLLKIKSSTDKVTSIIKVPLKVNMNLPIDDLILLMNVNMSYVFFTMDEDGNLKGMFRFSDVIKRMLIKGDSKIGYRKFRIS